MFVCAYRDQIAYGSVIRIVRSRGPLKIRGPMKLGVCGVWIVLFTKSQVASRTEQVMMMLGLYAFRNQVIGGQLDQSTVLHGLSRCTSRLLVIGHVLVTNLQIAFMLPVTLQIVRTRSWACDIHPGSAVRVAWPG